MALIEMHSWVRFSSGLVVGCWLGTAIGCALALVVAGRRLRQLQTANLLLRVKLRTRDRRARANAAGPLLVVPPAGSRAAASGAMPRYASGGR